MITEEIDRELGWAADRGYKIVGLTVDPTVASGLNLGAEQSYRDIPVSIAATGSHAVIVETEPS